MWEPTDPKKVIMLVLLAVLFYDLFFSGNEAALVRV